jgi:hypothetical protein
MTGHPTGCRIQRAVASDRLSHRRVMGMTRCCCCMNSRCCTTAACGPATACYCASSSQRKRVRVSSLLPGRIDLAVMFIPPIALSEGNSNGSTSHKEERIWPLAGRTATSRAASWYFPNCSSSVPWPPISSVPFLQTHFFCDHIARAHWEQGQL